jgi:acyl carrier protein
MQKKASGSVSQTALPTTGNDTFSIVQHIIAETTGIDLEEITLDADLEEDLGINMMDEFPAIVTKIQKQIDVILPVNAVKECVTVAELVELVDDEREL